MVYIILCVVVSPAKCRPIGPSWRSCNTFSESRASKHLRNTPLWCFLKITSCTNYQDNNFNLISLFYHVDKWEEKVSCSMYWHTSAYQDFVIILGEPRSALYISISFFHLDGKSSVTSTTSVANQHRAWNLMLWTGLNSKTYSYRPVI